MHYADNQATQYTYVIETACLTAYQMNLTFGDENHRILTLLFSHLIIIPEFTVKAVCLA